MKKCLLMQLLTILILGISGTISHNIKLCAMSIGVAISITVFIITYLFFSEPRIHMADSINYSKD